MLVCAPATSATRISRRCAATPSAGLGDEEDVGEDAIRRAFKASTRRRGRLAAPTPSIWRGAAAGRALDSRDEHDQAALRSSGRGGPGHIQEAGASEPLLSHLSMASTRLVLDVDVSPGDDMRPNTARRAVGLIERLPRDLWPRCCAATRLRQRGDHARGEARDLSFKLRLTAKVKRMIEKLASAREWSTPARVRGEGERVG